MSSQTETRDLAPQPTVCVRVVEPSDRLGDLFGELLPLVAERIADLGGEVAGPAYGRFREFSPERMDVEIGIPVVAPMGNLPPAGEAPHRELASGELPGGRAVVTLHGGSYAGLSAVYGQLEAWMTENGHRPGGAPWESYVVDMSEVDDAEQLRTEVVWPLA